MKLTNLAIAVSGLLLVGCVTINIYFPASAAEQAADKIIDEIWKPTRESVPASNDKVEKP